jgi:hypothetical protein
MMKTIIFIWFAVSAVVASALLVDGSGFFPVMVQVFDADTVTPI